MKLFFHVGLNKSGSSYLQVALPFSFGQPGPTGILYPEPHDPNGNAIQLTRCIRELDEAGAMRATAALIEACDSSATAILSSEHMYHQILRAPQRALLMRCLQVHGQHDVTFVAVFRNIFEHAFSAYSHRAGEHLIPQFAEWIHDTGDALADGGVTRYEFWSEARSFLESRIAEELRFTFVDYATDLDEAFSQVIGAPLRRPPHSAVNVSVTLAEAEILRHLRLHGQERSRHLRFLLKGLRRSEKAPDLALRKVHALLIDREIERNAEQIAALEACLGFSVSRKPAAYALSDGESERADISLSLAQVATLVDGLMDRRAHRRRGPIRGFLRSILAPKT